jgi:putative transposase
MAQADADENGGPRLTSAEKKELAELRRKNRLLEQENEILRRAAAYFARENVLPPIAFRLAHELAADDMDAAVACRLPGVSRSGYYEWKGRPESARGSASRNLLKLIERVHAESRGSYGSPRVSAELWLGLGMEVNRKRVERLLRQAGIQGICRRRGRKNLVNAATGEDLVRRSFTAGWPERLIVKAGYLPVRGGSQYWTVTQPHSQVMWSCLSGTPQPR